MRLAVCTVVLAVVSGISCDDSQEASRPSAEELVGSQHPALSASVPKAEPRSTARGASGEGLPAGHPPIDDARGAGGAGAEGSWAPGERFEVAGLEFKPPASWQRERPASSFRSAQFRIEPAEGDRHDGELTVSLAAGDLESNIERWLGQFEASDRSEPIVTSGESGGFKTTYVDMTGTYLYSLAPMAGGGGEPRPGYRVLVAIVDAPRGQQIFFKLFGPQKTITAAEPGFRAMIESLHSH